jgi:hypothetical protein
LKQFGVIPPISASISFALSARMCSRNAAMRLADLLLASNGDIAEYTVGYEG